MSRIVAGIQARMGSTRLPGKSLISLGEKPIIHWVIDRLLLAKTIDEVWLLAPTNPEDAALVAAVQEKVKVIQGHPQDVASRYQTLFEKTDATFVLRVTGDCPLVDAALIDRLVDQYFTTGASYGHIVAQPYYDPSYPNGFNAELFSWEAFQRMRILETTLSDREHVTLAVDQFPEQFVITRLAPPPELSRPQWKLSVDTIEDLNRVRSVVEALGNSAEFAAFEDILAVLDAHPEW